MTAFWIVAVLLAAVALALVLRPMLLSPRRSASRSELNVSVYRDQLRELDADLRAGTLAQADYERSRSEIERRLLEDVERDPGVSAAPPPRTARSAIAVAAAIPIVALAVYFVVGNPDALDARLRAAPPGMQEIEAMVQRLADRLAEKPDDLEGWKMLGKSYSVMGRFPDAANAYSKAAIRAPRDPQLLADLADALAMARGQSMKGEPEELVLRALQVDPNNLKALALAGTAAYERQDFAAAAKYWQRMLPLVPAGSEDARTIAANVEEAKAMAGRPAAAKGAALRGTVKLSAKFASRVSPEDTVFIFARAADGPPMPVAVLRKKARDLPIAFALDDSMAMAGRKLSDHPRVVVGARISKSGNATPQPGDFQGASPPVASSGDGVSVTIDKVVP